MVDDMFGGVQGKDKKARVGESVAFSTCIFVLVLYINNIHTYIYISRCLRSRRLRAFQGCRSCGDWE